MLSESVAGQEEPEHKQKELRRQLWRAPELLRSLNPPPQGTQKGDVYSFAIVLYEIMGRAGPWGQIEIPPDGRCRNDVQCYAAKQHPIPL
jgi:guanylate cyclase